MGLGHVISSEHQCAFIEKYQLSSRQLQCGGTIFEDVGFVEDTFQIAFFHKSMFIQIACDHHARLIHM